MTGAVEQDARQIDRLLGLRVGDDDVDLAGIGLRGANAVTATKTR